MFVYFLKKQFVYIIIFSDDDQEPNYYDINHEPIVEMKEYANDFEDEEEEISQKNLVYELFKKKGDKAICKICSTVLSTMGGTTTTLRRHAARFHELEWAEIVSRAETQKKSKSRTQALIYQIFEKLGTEALCRICHKVFNTARGNTSTIRRHAERAHPDVWRDIQAKNSQNDTSNYIEVKEENVMDYHLSPDSFMFVDQGNNIVCFHVIFFSLI